MFEFREVIPLVAAALLVAAPASADAPAPPRTDAVTASLSVTAVQTPTTFTCQGVDGSYTQLKDTFVGNITSSDPRLNGVLQVDANILVNTTTGNGAGSGTWSVRDLLGNVLSSGKFRGVVGQFVQFKGLAWGESGSSSVFASLSVQVTGNTAVGTLGAPLASVLTDGAVFQLGSCSGAGP